MFQKLNVGGLDRLVRAALGLGVVVNYNLGDPPLAWLVPLGLLGLASALMGSCPFYSVLGLATRRRRRGPPEYRSGQSNSQEAKVMAGPTRQSGP